MNISVNYQYTQEIISDVNSVTHLHAIPQLRGKIKKGILFMAVRLIPFEFQIRTEYLAWYSALVVSYRCQDEKIAIRLESVWFAEKNCTPSQITALAYNF